MSRRANPTLIGGFVLGGVLLSVVAVVVFGSGQLFRDTRTFVSFFDGSVSGLDAGSPVRFRGIDVGSVTEVLLDMPDVDRPGEDLRVVVIYELDRDLIESRGAAARLEDPLDVNTLLDLGVRAELATESLVTGRKYIALDLDPSEPVPLEPVPGLLYPQIPTVTTGLERIQEEVYGIIADLGAVKLDTLLTVATDALGKLGELAGSEELSATLEGLPETVERLNTTVGDLQALLTRVDSALAPMGEGIERTAEQAIATFQQLDTTLVRVGTVMEGVGALVEPESPALVRFERAMIDLSEASRALRDLTDYIERNPSALIRGRPGGGG